MNRNWNFPVIPTAVPADSQAIADEFECAFPEYSKLTDRTRDFIVRQIKDLSVQISERRQYCPSTWVSRAYNLLRLGYPDLAAGDAYKAKLLIAFHDDNTSTFSEKVKSQIRWQATAGLYFRTNTWPQSANEAVRRKEYVDKISDRATVVLAQTLFVANCYIECYELLENYAPLAFTSRDAFNKLEALARRAQLLEDNSRILNEGHDNDSSKSAYEARRSGTIAAQIYPWMSKFVRRDGVVMDIARSNVDKASRGACRLGTSTIEDQVAATDQVEKESKTLGVFAARDLDQDELIMFDEIVLSGVDGHDSRCSCCHGRFDQAHLDRYPAPCCEVFFCSEDCLKLFMREYHARECMKPPGEIKDKKVLLGLENPSQDTIAMNDLLYRVILVAENEPWLLPLQIPQIAAMIPAYRSAQRVLFSFQNDIQRPLTMLLDLGIDPFDDLGFDTWAIQTIQNRLRNNVRVYEDNYGQYHATVNVSYMFFNHSCDPNVTIIPRSSGRSEVLAYTTRPVKAGSELFINYLTDDILALPYAERQERLKDWTGGQCRCLRCREARGQVYKDRHTGEYSSVVVIPGDDEGDEDHQDDELPAVGLDTNRYASPGTLRDQHPSMKRLRSRVFSSQIADYDEGDEICKSPLTNKRSRRGL